MQIVFPDAEDAPASPAQSLINQAVTGDVGGELLFPERTVAGGLRAVLGTAMPEAAVNEDCEPQLLENKIRPDFETSDA
jgi:hypothetical protein